MCIPPSIYRRIPAVGQSQPFIDQSAQGRMDHVIIIKIVHLHLLKIIRVVFMKGKI